jgi:hypothetical protein
LANFSPRKIAKLVDFALEKHISPPKKNKNKISIFLSKEKTIRICVFKRITAWDGSKGFGSEETFLLNR